MTLRTTELARIRATAAAWLPQTASITRPDGGQTTDGWPDASPTTVVASTACRVEPDGQTGNERGTASGVSAGDRWLVYFPHDIATLKPMDTVTVSSVGVFEVQAVSSGRGVNTDVVARCIRLEAV